MSGDSCSITDPMSRHARREIDIRLQFQIASPCNCERSFHGRERLPARSRRETRYFALHVQTGSAHSELSLCCCKWVRDQASYSSTSFRADIDSDIATAAIGPRSVVATGADELEACQWEVEADTERFIQTAEVCLFHLPFFVCKD